MVQMLHRIGAAVLVLATMTAGASSSQAAPVTPAGKAAPTPAPAPRAPSAAPAEGRSETRSDSPAVSQDAAARARMHECAHQWSTIKKSGNAGLTTWKEFSATCLVVSR